MPPSAGKIDEAGPEPASLTAFCELEAAGGRAAVVDGGAVLEGGARRGADCERSAFVGCVLSTRTLVTSADVKRVADVVGGDDAQVVEAVGDGGRVPVDGVGAGGVGGADVRPRTCAGGGALELGGGDARAAVGRVRGDGDGVPRTFALAAGAVTEPVGCGRVVREGEDGGIARVAGGSCPRADSVGPSAPAFQAKCWSDVGAAGRGVDGLGRVRPACRRCRRGREIRRRRAGAAVGDRVGAEVAGCRAAVVDGVAVLEAEPAGSSDWRRERVVGRVLSTRTFVTSAEVKRVADVVGRDHAQVVEAVGDGGRVPVDRVGRVVSAAPMFVQVPAPAGERWNWALKRRRSRRRPSSRRR